MSNYMKMRGSPKIQNTLSSTHPSTSSSPPVVLTSLAQHHKHHPTSSAASLLPPLPSSLSSSSSRSVTTPTTTSTMAVTSTVPPGARSTSPCSAATAGGPYGQPTPSTPTSSGRCCDTGRTIFTDPVTGQTLCSCQYDLLNYPRLAAAGGIPVGPGGVPLGVYPEGVAAYLSSMGADQPPFYPNPAGLDLKENLVAGGAPWPYPSVYHPYDTAFAAYPFNSYGMDLNGARRKNATRETTSTLKAWLNEHKKNPYPTKGEKIMLAIITKMTLTQVSTWFANARRRLKKENKMTWEPRNRVDDDDVALDDDDKDDDKDLLDAKDSGTGSTESNRLDVLDRPEGNSEWSGSRPGSANGSPDLYDHHHLHHARHMMPGGHPLLHPAALQHFRPPAGSPPESHHNHLNHHPLVHHVPHHHHTVSALSALSGSNSNINKPRIWSLADMASKESKDGSTSTTNSSSNATSSNSNSNNNNNNSSSSNNNTNSDSIPPPSSLYTHPSQHSSPGKILSPLAARLPNYPPYGRPDLYRGFYGAAAAAAHLGAPTSAEFLDHHQRSFQASLAAHHGMNPLLWKAAVSAGAAAGAPPFAPLSLTTNNHHSNSTAPQPGASPSASSTSSSMGGGDNNPLNNSAAQPPNSVQHISGNSSTSSGSTSGRISPGISSNGSKP